jgi:hypothetical protein
MNKSDLKLENSSHGLIELIYRSISLFIYLFLSKQHDWVNVNELSLISIN